MEEDYFTITSSSNTSGNGNNPSLAGNWTYNFNPLKTLQGKKWAVGLYGYSFWNTISNISKSIGNNVIGISVNSGGTYTNLTIPDGIYDIGALNSTIQNLIQTSFSNYGSSFSITASPNNLNLIITLTSTSSPTTYMYVDLTQSLIWNSLGYTSSTILAPAATTQSFISPSTANLQSPVTQINFVISGIPIDSTATYNSAGQPGTNGAIIYTTYPDPNVNPNTVQSGNVNPIIFIPMYESSVGSIELKNIQFSITDQNGSPINFNQGTINSVPNYNNNPASVSLYFFRLK